MLELLFITTICASLVAAVLYCYIRTLEASIKELQHIRLAQAQRIETLVRVVYGVREEVWQEEFIEL